MTGACAACSSAARRVADATSRRKRATSRWPMPSPGGAADDHNNWPTPLQRSLNPQHRGQNSGESAPDELVARRDARTAPRLGSRAAFAQPPRPVLTVPVRPSPLLVLVTSRAAGRAPTPPRPSPSTPHPSLAEYAASRSRGRPGGRRPATYRRVPDLGPPHAPEAYPCLI